MLVVLELVAPFTSHSFGVDGSYHLNWLREFSDLFSHGILIPRWIPGAYYGFGAPSFYFYPPLTYYLGSIFRVVFGQTDPEVLFHLTGLAATIASYLSARLLLARFPSSSYQKNIGALIYAFAPLRIAELYSRSNLSVHVSYVFVPLVWCGIAMIAQEKANRNLGILVLGASLALLLMTNIPIFLLTISCIALAAILFRRELSRTLLRDVTLAGVLAFGLSAFYTFSIISFRSDAKLTDLLVVNPDYIIEYLVHGVGIPAAYHIALIACAFLFGGGAILLMRRSNRVMSDTERILARFGVAFAIIVIFLNIPVLSVPVWRYFPPLPLVQDAWRLYSVGVLLAGVMIGTASSRPLRRAAQYTIWLWVLGGIVPILLVVFNTHFYTHYDRSADVATEYLPRQAVPVERVMPTMKEHENDPAATASLVDNDRVALVSIGAEQADFEIRFSRPYLVTFHRFYWPGWHLYARGQEVENASDSIGRAIATLPAGNYEARWGLEPSPLERSGIWLSVFSLAALCGILGLDIVRRRTIVMNLSWL